MQNNSQFLIIIALIAYSAFRRVMRALNFQKYKQGALLFKVGLYCFVALILLASAALNPMSYLFYLIGAVAGGVLVFIAVKNMIFEKRADGLYYRTHVWVEIAVLVLFFARLIYRFYIMSQVMGVDATDPDAMSKRLQYTRDPFTSFVFFLLCTYYIGYYFYVYKRSAEAIKTIPEFVEVKNS